MKYRKKPVTIEAYQTDVEMDIPTLEGTMHASVGDYIITGVHGEQYPCKPDIFIETYEPADGNGDATLGDVPHLPYFWTADGTLHIELPKLPESISVRLPDQRDREAGSARTWQYTQGSGTCKDVCNSVSEFTCSVCGFNCDLTSWIKLFDGDDGRHRHHHHGTPNYCPNCGRKVVDE